VTNRFKNLLKKQWAFGLWVGIFILVLIFGLWGRAIMGRWGYEWNFWLYWEVSALGSTILFNILFYILGFFMPPQMFLNLKKGGYIGLIVLLEFISIAGLSVATWISLKEKSCFFQMLSILVVAVCFLTLDSVMARQSQNEKVREDFRASVALNDKPALMAFVVLFIFSWIYPVSHDAPGAIYDDKFRAFIGGAIAFQMLVSNWVLALIFRKPGEWYHDEGASTTSAS
jgi:hypothetical protein